MLLNGTLQLPLSRKIDRSVCYLTNLSEKQKLEISDFIVYNFYTYIHRRIESDILFVSTCKEKAEHMNVCSCLFAADSCDDPSRG